MFNYRIKGQKRPFIDEDLQLQLPGLESSEDFSKIRSSNQIYSYYSTAFPSLLNFPTSIQQSELVNAMSEAQQAYDAWKKMKQQIQSAIQQLKTY